MKRLSDIKNYLVIHNGVITTKEISEEISIENTHILVKQATNLCIEYTGNEKKEYSIDIDMESATVDMIEFYHFEAETTLHKNIHIAPNCQVSRYVDNQSKEIHLNIEEQVVMERDAVATCAYVELGDYDVWGHFQYQLVGENANANLRLASLAKGSEDKKYTVSLQHLAPYTTGNMDNYGIVRDTSRLVIDGIGTIKKGNHQSNSHQTNKILVFDPKCQAKANPYLYIDEYDVKASHGASVGKIDEEQLYYLQSRGLTRQDAMHLVTYGYFLPIIHFIKNNQLKEQFESTLKEKVGI